MSDVHREQADALLAGIASRVGPDRVVRLLADLNALASGGATRIEIERLRDGKLHYKCELAEKWGLS